MDSIENIARQRPEILVGAGTVFLERDAIDAKESGAKFLVSPGIDPELLSLASEMKTLFYSGFHDTE